MTFALFGIENDGLNLAVNLLVFFLVVIWLALVYWTYSDASRRLDDPMLVWCATSAALFPFIGTIVYTIVRPPEYLEDARERDLEIKAAEARVRVLESRTCRNCGGEIDPTYLRCPHCMRRLREPCKSCGKPVDPQWRICPYCELPLETAAPRARRAGERRSSGSRAPRQSGGRTAAARASEADDRQRPARSAAPPADERPDRPPERVTPRPLASEGKIGDRTPGPG